MKFDVLADKLLKVHLLGSHFVDSGFQFRCDELALFVGCYRPDITCSVIGYNYGRADNSGAAAIGDQPTNGTGCFLREGRGIQQ